MTIKLLARYVHFPCEIVEVCWGFPQVAGAMDRTHVPVIKPPSDYYNGKGFYSISMQAVGTFLRHIYWLAW